MEVGGFMNRYLKIAIPAVVAGFGLLISANVSYAKPEYTKKEKKGCVYCHVSASSKELNDVGKCYKTSKSLDGCAKKG